MFRAICSCFLFSKGSKLKGILQFSKGFTFLYPLVVCGGIRFSRENTRMYIRFLHYITLLLYFVLPYFRSIPSYFRYLFPFHDKIEKIVNLNFSLFLLLNSSNSQGSMNISCIEEPLEPFFRTL